MSVYCVYLTIYDGNKLPIFYIGSSTVKKINNGYRGSVQSKEYGKIWKEELKHNPSLFRTKIVSLHCSREEAFIKEEKLQKRLDVIKNPLYTNKSFANSKFSLKQHSSWTRKKFKSRIPWNKGKTDIYTAETKARMGKPKGSSGKKHTEETKKKLRGPNPKKSLPGNLNGMYGKTHRKEVREKLALVPIQHLKGKTYEEIYGLEKSKKLRKQRSESAKGKNNSGKNNPRYDHREYAFINTETGQLLFCTRFIFKTISGLPGGEISNMINHNLSYKNWCTVHSYFP